jgi:hypothetical protein
MADQVANLQHDELLVFGVPQPGSVLNSHKFPDGLPCEGWPLVYRDAEADNFRFSNDMSAVLNCPMRQSLIASSAEISSFTTVQQFNKSLTVPGQTLSAAGTVLYVVAGGVLSTHATTPGDWQVSVWLNGASGQNIGGCEPVTLLANRTNLAWSIEGIGVVRSVAVPTAATVWGSTIDVRLPSTVPAVMPRLGQVAQNLVAASTIDFYVAGSVASPSNKITLEWAYYTVMYGSSVAT